MITDQDSNFLYLADTLPQLYPSFYKRFEQTLKDNQVNYALLPETKDVWAVDYMPIQVDDERFVQFRYNPDYLQTVKLRKTISDVYSICDTLCIKPLKSTIVLDGGNVIRWKDRVIMCDKVFRENPAMPEKTLIKELRTLLEVDHICFIPTDKADKIGHADGMVRFLDYRTVLINDYSKEKSEFQLTFRMALHNAGLDWIEVPYNPYRNKQNIQANGIYINYLQMDGCLVLPIFNQKEDEEAVKLFSQLFPKTRISTVESNEIAQEGGILNCITWNVKN
ncbi:agmatine deiminase family protein [Rufibacter sp. DG15C]|uniref:agmatine deiminase family protein n=1 Tax=Rufibacter sp. DG15C TaxID=1379909 RepID=UPI00082A2608|nr:agmatine deiminase family protein [Rufibacter sp. DG15C]